MSAFYQPIFNEHIKNILLAPLALISTIHICFNPCHSKLMNFHAKIYILGKYLYISHTLLILYIEGNHTFGGEKLYIIWKFSSGNTA